MTGVSFLTNDKGEKTAVQLSIKKWNELQKDLKKLAFFEELKKGVQEMELHAKGKLKTPTTKQLLSQL